MEEVRLKEVAHSTGNVSIHVDSSVNIPRQEFGIGFFGLCISDCSVLVLIPPEVLLVRMHIISKFELWTLAPNTDLLLEIM
jgi:hypothetical protein